MSTCNTFLNFWPVNIQRQFLESQGVRCTALTTSIQPNRGRDLTPREGNKCPDRQRWGKGGHVVMNLVTCCGWDLSLETPTTTIENGVHLITLVYLWSDWTKTLRVWIGLSQVNIVNSVLWFTWACYCGPVFIQLPNTAWSHWQRSFKEMV